MTTKAESYVERDRKRHHNALEQLARSLDPRSNQSGLQLWRKLNRIERKAHQAATDYCNGAIDSDQIELIGIQVAHAVKNVFGKLPPHFRFNLDARGYALKLSSSDDGCEPATPFDLHQDWGRNQILAPVIE